MDNKRFAKEICRSRNKKGYTQSAVAEMLGMSLRWYQRIEKGENLPGTENFIKLLILPEVNVDVLKELITEE